MLIDFTPPTVSRYMETGLKPSLILLQVGSFPLGMLAMAFAASLPRIAPWAPRLARFQALLVFMPDATALL